MMVQGHLQLVAWSVSGQPSKVEAFQRMQFQSSVLPGGPTLKLPTLVPGTNGQDGANKFILACWMRPCMKPPSRSEKEDSLV